MARLLDLGTSVEIKSLRLVSRGGRQAVDNSIWALKPRVMRLEEVSRISFEKEVIRKETEMYWCHTYIASKLTERSNAILQFHTFKRIFSEYWYADLFDVKRHEITR